MQLRVSLTALAVSLVAASTHAGEPPLLQGAWRIEARDADGRALGGRLRVFQSPSGAWRYERESRLDVAGPYLLEQGLVEQERAEVRLRSDAGEGFAQELVGEDCAPGSVGRYRRDDQGWRGQRREGDGRLSQERLLPDRPEDRNHVRLLVDGEAYPLMEAEIRAARRSIDIQTFQWADDSTGRRIAEALAERARSGVRVRLLVDGASSITNQMVSLHMDDPKVDFTGRIYKHGWRTNYFRNKTSLEKELRAAGCQVIVAHTDMQSLGGSLSNTAHSIANGFKRLFGVKPKPREERGLWNHDHRKTMVVDERVAFCGGMNIASEYELDWHDCQVRVEGPAAHQFHGLFVDRWRAAGGEAELEPAPCEEWTGDAPVTALGSIPGIDPCIRELYFREIAGARERIMIEVAYFLDDRVIDLLGQAAGRGVKTVVVVPAEDKNDVYLVKEAFAWVHNEVVKSGVELYFYDPTLTHSKLGVFDGARATVGSCNLDKIALDDISEANAWIPDARFAHEVEARIFAVDLPKCTRAAERKLPFKRKITAGLLHFFRGLL